MEFLACSTLDSIFHSIRASNAFKIPLRCKIFAPQTGDLSDSFRMLPIHASLLQRTCGLQRVESDSGHG